MKLFNETTKLLLIIAALGNGSRAQDNVTPWNESAVSEAGQDGVEADRANRVDSQRLGVFGGEVDDVTPGQNGPPSGFASPGGPGTTGGPGGPFAQTPALDLDFFEGGVVDIDTDTLYYTVSAELPQEALRNLCFVDSVLPADVAQGVCPDGKLELSLCRQTCEDMMIKEFTNCPLNLAGCCECGYYSFKTNNLASGDLYEFRPGTSNVFWTILPGWVNLGVWTFLTASLMFLMLTRNSMPKARTMVVRITRVVGWIGMLAFSMWGLVYLVGMNGLGYQFYFAFPLSRVGILIHVIFSSLWLISGVIQLVGPIRRMAFGIHRANGWLCVASTVLASVGLFILLLAPHQSAIGGIFISAIFAAYWNVSLGLGCYYGIKRDIDSHRRWMVRHMFVGNSVILGRIFNVLVEIIFKDQAYYVGPFYDAACEDLAGVKYAEIMYISGETAYLSTEQMSFACRGITTLYDSYFFAVQFAVVMLVAGIFAAELWLWATGLQHSQQTVSLAQTSIRIPSVGGTEDKRPLMVICNLKEELPITLVEKEAIATDAVKMRFSLPDANSGLLIEQLGHVNLRKADMIRPRPYSPIISLEAGFGTFIVRHASRGLLSTYMVQQMKEGQSLLLSGPMAPVIAPSLQHAKNLLLIAGGAGIAPFYSLVETTEAKCHVLMAEKDQSCERRPMCMDLQEKDCYDQELHTPCILLSVAYLLHLELDHEAHRKEQTKQNKKNRRKVLVCTPKQVPVAAEAPPKKPAPKKATVKKAAGKKQATLTPTAVTPVSKADPADKVDGGTLLQDPAVNKLLAMITNQPGLFTQVANSAAAVADNSAASNKDDSVSETSVVEVVAATSKKVPKTTRAGTAVTIKQESNPAGNDTRSLSIPTKPVEDRGLSGLDIETNIGGRSALISNLVAFMKDTVYKTRTPSVTKRRTFLQHFMRTGVQLWCLTIEEQRKVLSQDDGTCYAASENDYEWTDPEQPFINVDDDNDEEEEQDEDEDEHDSEN
ncbi:Nitrate reductase [Seminavis robusta]|uniref:Nitrate reductase n=1 Tax=Seminavis robusta TaxID=568900 RepID=A0A9N8F2H7_9STRA|nr:Nitrate reductase [Seminavis robusta]|eukprot:Sro3550_g349150.1 Nitrate reductase (995) ;mRNA; f:2682-5877